jgi:hypothetical protein
MKLPGKLEKRLADSGSEEWSFPATCSGPLLEYTLVVGTLAILWIMPLLILINHVTERGMFLVKQ